MILEEKQTEPTYLQCAPRYLWSGLLFLYCFGIHNYRMIIPTVILELQVVHHRICFKPQFYLQASRILISAADKRPDGAISCANAPLPSLN